jgi:hypothetical protein
MLGLILTILARTFNFSRQNMVISNYLTEQSGVHFARAVQLNLIKMTDFKRYGGKKISSNKGAN